MNKLQKELLLRVGQIFLAFGMVWQTFWMLIYDVLYWGKPFSFFYYLQDLLIIILCLIGIGLTDFLLEHPEISLRRPAAKAKAKEKKVKKKKDSSRPLF